MKERFWLKPTAILLGIFAWLYVNIISESPITREVNIKIKYLNMDATKDYRIIPKSPEVKLTVRGPRRVFIQTKIEENTSASVDLINAHGGKLTLPVNVILPSNSNLELVSKEPAQLVINSILMVTKMVPVKVNKIGNVPEGYMNSEPQVTPEILMVTAPTDVINTIRECSVDAELTDVRRSISEYKPVSVIYTDGKTAINPSAALIEIPNCNVKLDVAVREGYPEKIVPVKPVIINKAPEGRKLESFIALPDKVTITGPQKLLDSVDSVSLESVDVAKIQKSTTVNVAAICPKGLKVIGKNSVALTINYADVNISKTIQNLPVEITCSEDQLVEPLVSTYSIELEGIVDDINAINISELKNIVFVKGLSSGTHDIAIAPPYGLSERVKVKSITPATLSVTINLLEKVEIPEETNASESASIVETVAEQIAPVASESEKIASQTEDLSDKK